MSIVPIPGFSEPFSSWSHLLAAAAAVVGWIVLLRRGRGSGPRLLALSCYSFTLTFLFSMSAVYHLLEPGFLARLVLQRLDHAGIWLLIAGTFTPIHVVMFRRFWRWGMLAIIWTLGITGLVLEAIFFYTIPDWLLISMFLGLGWLGVFSAYRCIRDFGLPKVWLLVGGGLAYSLGAVLELTQVPAPLPGVIGAHELFHIFTVVGAVLHWLFIYKHARLPTVSRVRFLVRERPGNRFFAKLQGDGIKISARSLDILHQRIEAAVRSNFPESLRPRKVQLIFMREDSVSIQVCRDLPPNSDFFGSTG